MKRTILAVLLVLTPLIAFAQAPAATTIDAPPVAGTAPAPGDMLPQVGVHPTPITVNQTPAAVIDTGTYAGQTLMYAVTVGGSAIAAMLVKVLLEVLKMLGVKTSQAMRDKLQAIAVNAINYGAAEAAKKLEGQGKIEIKNEAVATAVTYVQTHGADTLKQLGIDPTSPEAVEAIKARIETAIADPATPTAAVLDPVGEPSKIPPIQVSDAKLEAAAGVAKT